MKTQFFKKICISLILILCFITLFGCSTTNNSGSGNNNDDNVITEKNVLGMIFADQTEYESISYYLEINTDNSIKEKSIVYTLDENRSITFAAVINKKISDLVEDIDSLEKVEYNNKTWYRYDQSYDQMLMTETDDTIYIIYYVFDEDENNSEHEIIDNFAKTVKFTNIFTKTVSSDIIALDNMQYDLKDLPEILISSIYMTQDKENKNIEKSISIRFNDKDENGEDDKYRFTATLYYNEDINNKISTTDDYKEVSINDQNFKTTANVENRKFYIIQIDNNVYSFSNDGTGSWFATRSDNSYTSFEKFMSTIKFN